MRRGTRGAGAYRPAIARTRRNDGSVPLWGPEAGQDRALTQSRMPDVFEDRSAGGQHGKRRSRWRWGPRDERDDDARRTDGTVVFQAGERAPSRGAVVGVVAAPREQIRWYSRGARRKKRWYMRIKLVRIVSAARRPVLAATACRPRSPPASARSIVVLESVQRLFQFRSDWTHYRSTSEALKHEKYLYLGDTALTRRPPTRRPC